MKAGVRLHNVSFNPGLCSEDAKLIDLVGGFSNWNWKIFKDNIHGNVVHQISFIAPPH